MAYTYHVDRLYSDVYGWLIDNQSRIDGNGRVVKLTDWLKTYFPSNACNVRCEGPDAWVTFNDELDASGIATLETEAANYQVVV